MPLLSFERGKAGKQRSRVRIRIATKSLGVMIVILFLLCCSQSDAAFSYDAGSCF